MTNRDIIQTVIGSIGAACLLFALAFATSLPDGWEMPAFVLSLLFAAASGGWWLVLERRKSSDKATAADQDKEKEKKMGDKYQVFGANYGHVGPAIYGKVPFRLTNAIIQEVLTHLPKKQPINVTWIGSSQSRQIAEQLEELLISNGFTIGERDSCGIHFPPMEQALTYDVEKKTLYIDADK